MSGPSSSPVVVAVGHDPMDAALVYAAAEAARASCGLHLLHVVAHPVYGPEAGLVDLTAVRDAGELAVGAARRLARELLPAELPVTTEVRSGGVVAGIAAADADARVIVLQRRSLSRVARVLTRSVSSGVAAHAGVPVVSVPADWTPARPGRGTPTVTMGVDVPERSEDLLRVALQAARERGVRLRIVHTWVVPGMYGDLLMSRTQHDAWTDEATRGIECVLAGLAPEAAGVDIAIEVSHGPAGDALVEAGRTSELLVVGRHDPVVPLGSHLGPVARAVLQEATCPVLLADARPRAPRHHRTRHVRAG